MATLDKDIYPLLQYLKVTTEIQLRTFLLTQGKCSTQFVWGMNVDKKHWIGHSLFITEP